MRVSPLLVEIDKFMRKLIPFLALFYGTTVMLTLFYIWWRYKLGWAGAFTFIIMCSTPYVFWYGIKKVLLKK